MKCIVFVLLLSSALAARAQSQPTGACPFRDFDPGPQHDPQIAQVATPIPALTLMACDSPKGCVKLHVDPGSPVLIYTTVGPWTCGYSEDGQGAGPAWFRTGDLHAVAYDRNPPLTAWAGTWVGGEDRVVIALTKDGTALSLRGNATWHGNVGVEHFGDTEGNATPAGNHLHFVEGGTNSCTIDLTLLGKFILASDNNLCGGMNARFQGFWTRALPRTSR